MNILIALVAMAVTLAGLILTNNRGLRQDMARDCRLPSAAMAVWSLAAVLLLAVGSPPCRPRIRDQLRFISLILPWERVGKPRSLLQNS